MRALLYFSVLVSLLMPLCTTAGTGTNEPAVLAVIVARNQAVRSLSVTEASLIYWRKKLYWADGKRMLPLNLPTDHPLRKAFSQAVLGSLPETQTEYWNGLYYQGTSPPHVVASQEAMLRFVEETPGAIGYVDACKVDARVKVVLWLDESGIASAPVAGKDCLGQ
ncbi:MAG TPA: hypothetical protein VK974_01515 [Methylophilaceae bacterium]|nr:hypothetical protein [Methylophilaceae bacterium]